MKKLSLLLTIFGLLACRSPRDATQTVIRVRATDELQMLAATIKTEVVSLPKNTPITKDEGPAAWPVKRTFVPQGDDSNKRFKFVVSVLDATNTERSRLELETEIVEGASRYLNILLSPGECLAKVGADALRTSPEQARVLEAPCEGGLLVQPPPAMSGADDTGMPGAAGDDGNGGPPDTATGQNQTTTGAVTGTGTAANGGMSGTGAPADAGKMTTTEGACTGNPCLPNGQCALNEAAPKKYECVCTDGFMADETLSACVPRNDCLKDKGGCEDECVPDAVGAAQCSCTGANRWLKGDLKQCAQVNKAEELSTSSGSVERTRPQVAFDRAGNGVVAWTEADSAGAHTLWTARYLADTKMWQKPDAPFMRFYTSEAADLHLALDDSGSGLLIWTAFVEPHRQLRAARYRDGAFETPSRHIDSGTQGDTLMPSLALDAMGDGLIVWTDMVFPTSALRAANYHASSDTFSHVETFSGGDRMVFGTSVAINNNASGLIVWTDIPVVKNGDAGPLPDFTSALAIGARVTSAVGFGVTFGGDTPRSSSPDVVIDAQGNGVAVWLQTTGESSTYRVVSKTHTPGMTPGSGGWATEPQTLSARGNVFSAPRLAVGPDGSVFAAWRETIATTPTANMTPTPMRTRGALRVADVFGDAYELGLPSDFPDWGDIDTSAWSMDTTMNLLDAVQTSSAVAVGPWSTGFIAGASFDASMTPPTRRLWLQRLSATGGPTEPIELTPRDEVPRRPSAVELGLNANGDGAVVWDGQVDGRFHVFANVLD